MAVGDAGRGTIDEVGVDSDRGCVMAGRHGHGQQKIVTGGSERRRATAIACAAQSGPLGALGVHGHGAWWDEGGVAAVVDAPSEWGNPWMVFGGGRVRGRERGRERGRRRGMPGGCEAGMPTHEGRGRGMSVGGRCTYRASVRVRVCVWVRRRRQASSVKRPASSKRQTRTGTEQAWSGHGADTERTWKGQWTWSGQAVE
jgi:hypothetical protein